jgi:hypothetical protein
MNGRYEGGPEMADVELDAVSKKGWDMNWTDPDMDNLGGTTWRGTAAKDHDLSKVHAIDDGHIISL